MASSLINADAVIKKGQLKLPFFVAGEKAISLARNTR